jgi:universal stress protein E
MRPIKHILAIIDPTSDAQYCVEKGASLAHAFGAALELFICDYQSSVLLTRRLPAYVVDTAMNDRGMQLNRQLNALAEPLRRAGLQVLTGISFQEHLHVAVIGKVRTSGADLVIKDTHYHGVIQRALIANSDWHLIRECPVPLLLTKPSAWRAHIRVAAAIDPGHADDKPASLDRELLEVADRFAVGMGGQAMAVHAFDSLSLASGMTSVVNGVGSVPLIDLEIINALRKYHDNEFKAVLAGRPSFEGHAAMIEGSAVTQLPAYAVREHVDVLVTGAVSRSPVRRLFVGSTAERLLDRLPCDILVVKPENGLQGQQPSVDH